MKITVLYSHYKKQILSLILLIFFICVYNARAVPGNQQMLNQQPEEINNSDANDIKVRSDQKQDQNGEKSKSSEIRGNPFQYKVSNQESGFIPSSFTAIPSGIKVLAIIIVQNRKPLAVLETPGDAETLYVRPDDIIGIKHQNTKTGNNSSDIIYIKIEEITNQQVFLYPQKNPENIQILQ